MCASTFIQYVAGLTSVHCPHCLVLQAERRQRSVGLGSKSLDYELTGVHTYMTAVKRMTAARWKMLEDDK